MLQTHVFLVRFMLQCLSNKSTVTLLVLTMKSNVFLFVEIDFNCCYRYGKREVQNACQE